MRNGNVQRLIEHLNYASGHHSFPITDDTSIANVLRLSGIRIAPVTICLSTVVVDDPNFHAGVPERHLSYLRETIPKLYNMCKAHLRQKDPNSFDRTFFLVTTAGLTAEHTDARAAPLVHFHEFLAAATREIRYMLPIDSHQDAFYPAELETYRTDRDNIHREFMRLAMNKKPDMEVPDARRYAAALQRLMNRRLFITESGHLGLGPSSMMSGDTVAILFGGNVPYILRPLENGQWHFVGECYLDGYMRGEALGNAGKEPKSHEWFELV